MRTMHLSLEERIELDAKREARRLEDMTRQPRWARERRPLDMADVLQFEHDWPTHDGKKEEAIVHRFGVNVTRYYQKLNQLIDTPEALAADPQLVYRLREARATRARYRAARVLRQAR